MNEILKTIEKKTSLISKLISKVKILKKHKKSFRAVESGLRKTIDEKQEKIEKIEKTMKKTENFNRLNEKLQREIKEKNEEIEKKNQRIEEILSEAEKYKALVIKYQDESQEFSYFDIEEMEKKNFFESTCIKLPKFSIVFENSLDIPSSFSIETEFKNEKEMIKLISSAIQQEITSENITKIIKIIKEALSDSKEYSVVYENYTKLMSEYKNNTFSHLKLNEDYIKLEEKMNKETESFNDIIENLQSKLKSQENVFENSPKAENFEKNLEILNEKVKKT